MKPFHPSNLIKTTARALLPLSVSLLLVSCGGGGSESQQKRESVVETGTLNLKISIKPTRRKTSTNHPALKGKIDCAATKIENISVKMYRGVVMEKEAGPFKCAAGRASISGVKTGTLGITILGLDVSGKTLYRGESGEKTISKGDNSVVIQMVPENRVPLANAGTPRTVNINTEVVLSGAESSDPDDDSLSYLWTVENQPPGSGAALSDPSVVNPTFTPLVEGTYTLGLIVNDGQANSAKHTVSVTAEMPVVSNAGKWGGAVADPANDLKWSMGVWGN